MRRTFAASIKTVFAGLILLLALNQFNFGQGCFLSGGSTKFGALRGTTGDSRLDEVAAEEVERLRGMFALNPAFFFIDDRNAPNAYATPEVRDPQRPHGTILFGITLHSSVMAKSLGGTPIPMIMAHEFGHLFAYHSKLRYAGKRNELLADYIAGTYMFYRMSWKPTNKEDTLRTFFEIGDYSFNDPQHHGTPQERYTAVSRGYQDTEQIASSGRSVDLPTLLKLTVDYANSIR